VGLFKAFPDANFETLDLFIGPQGVVQEVLMTGTHKGQWQAYKPSGRTFHCRMVILIPWDATSRLFAGEKVYIDSDDVFRQRRS
jgi:predicted ester cyclase